MKNTRKLLSALLVIVMMLTTTAFAAPAQDRAGNNIAIPAEVNRIISLAPATTQIIESLGMMDKLVAVDTQTPLYVEGVSEFPQFDMMQPDIEQIAALLPDVIFTSGMSYVEDNPFTMLVDMGVCVIEIPSSSSITQIFGIPSPKVIFLIFTVFMLSNPFLFSIHFDPYCSLRD